MFPVGVESRVLRLFRSPRSRIPSFLVFRSVRVCAGLWRRPAGGGTAGSPITNQQSSSPRFNQIKPEPCLSGARGALRPQSHAWTNEGLAQEKATTGPRSASGCTFWLGTHTNRYILRLKIDLRSSPAPTRRGLCLPPGL